jgi:hypothetical protein
MPLKLLRKYFLVLLVLVFPGKDQFWPALYGFRANSFYGLSRFVVLLFFTRLLFLFVLPSTYLFPAVQPTGGRVQVIRTKILISINSLVTHPEHGVSNNSFGTQMKIMSWQLWDDYRGKTLMPFLQSNSLGSNRELGGTYGPTGHLQRGVTWYPMWVKILSPICPTFRASAESYVGS